MEVLAVIPARGGSKRLPGKNIKMLCGRPLIAYTIDAAKDCRLINRIVVSTDDAGIARVARELGVEVIGRPDDLARDESRIHAVISQVLTALENAENYEPEYVVLLQPTSPLREPGVIEKCLYLIQLHGQDQVRTINSSSLLPDGQCYIYDCGMFPYIFSETLMTGEVLQDGDMVDIDTQEDFDRAEIILKRREEGGQEKNGGRA